MKRLYEVQPQLILKQKFGSPETSTVAASDVLQKSLSLARYFEITVGFAFVCRHGGS